MTVTNRVRCLAALGLAFLWLTPRPLQAQTFARTYGDPAFGPTTGYRCTAAEDGEIACILFQAGVFGLLCTDAAGNTLWQREYPNTWLTDIAYTDDGHFAVCGSSGGKPFMLKVLAGSGDVVWANGGDGNDLAGGLTETWNGKRVVCGTSDSFGAQDLWLLCVDAAGEASPCCTIQQQVSASPKALNTTVWPGGIPKGFSFGLQYLVRDAGAPDGWAFSNAIAGVTP